MTRIRFTKDAATYTGAFLFAVLLTCTGLLIMVAENHLTKIIAVTVTIVIVYRFLGREFKGRSAKVVH